VGAPSEAEPLPPPCRDPAPDDLVPLQFQKRFAGEEDRSPLGRIETRQAIEEGRLARAVGADEAEDFVVVDGEADIVDGDEAVKAPRHPARFECRQFLSARLLDEVQIVAHAAGPLRVRYASMNGSMPPSITFCTSGIFSSVR